MGADVYCGAARLERQEITVERIDDDGEKMQTASSLLPERKFNKQQTHKLQIVAVE
mgnify:CR=1 FL=1